MSDGQFVPRPGAWPVDGGTAELIADGERPGAFLLAVDGVAQSYVDLVDPTHLEFAYVRHLAAVLEPSLQARVRTHDRAGEPAGLPEVLHVGGGAGTLARYLSVVATGVRQTVVDVDARLVDGLAERLGSGGVDVEVADGRDAVGARAAGRVAAVVTDAFAGPHVPGELTTVEYWTDVRRVLRPDGVAAMNLADSAPFAFGRRVVAGLRRTFPSVVVVAEPGVLHGRRFGNLILAAGTELPVAQIDRRLAGDAAAPARMLAGDELDRWVGDAEPVVDAEPMPSPAPPPGVFSIR